MFLDNLYITIASQKEKNAFCIAEQFYTYTALARRIIDIQQLLNKHVDPSGNKRVGLLCMDDFSTYAAILAVWFSGYSYVPLGLHNPDERNISILEEAEISIIVTTVPLNNEVYEEYFVLELNDFENKENTGVAISYNTPVHEAVAYILFTSGSTGKPKGVPVTYKNLDAFITAFNLSPVNILPEDRCLQMFELTFDVSISSFLPALINGACVFTVPNDVIKNIYVLKLMLKHKLTVIQIVPSVIRLSFPLLPKITAPDVRICILTGEATQVDLERQWRKSIPSADIFNYYGPTEATIYCSYYKCPNVAVKQYNGMIAIGKPFNGMQMIVVNENNKVVSNNKKGELLISGGQVTSGYLNNKEKNNTAFVTIKNQGITGRFYRSGDFCYKDEDGDIFYCGRLDNQVKVQGYRIELSEIENCVREHFKLNSVAIPYLNKSGLTEILLTIESANNMSSDTLITKLKSILPTYMIPSKLINIESFPVTDSGKTDRIAIKSLINEAD